MVSGMNLLGNWGIGEQQKMIQIRSKRTENEAESRS